MKQKNWMRVLVFAMMGAGLLSGCKSSDVKEEATSEVADVPQEQEETGLLTEPTEIISEESTVKEEQPAQTEEQTQTEQTAAEGLSYEELSGYTFEFCSGAGAWQTTLTIDAAGHFAGIYSDSDMGDTGDSYPNGTVYYSQFEGNLGALEQVNDYTYRAKITDMTLSRTAGEEEIIDGVRTIYSEPYGVNNTDELIFYKKGAPINELPEGYKSWVSFALESDATELSFYGIYNEVEEDGFSSYPTVAQSNAVEAAEAMDLDEELEKIELQSDEMSNKLQGGTLSQIELNSLSGEWYRLWDDELNKLWGEIKEKLDTAAYETLLAEQKAWITEKEQAIQQEGEPYGEGTMRPLVENTKAAELTRARVYELAEYLR